MVIIILTNQLTLTLAILILIFQSNVLTNSYFSPYPNYSFKSFDPLWRPRRSFVTLTRPRRSFGEGREGADKGGKVGGRPWGSREAMARALRVASSWVGQTDRGREPAPQRVSKASPRHDARRVGPAVSAVAVAVDRPMLSAMHGAAAWISRAVQTGASKNVSFEKKTMLTLKIV